MASHATPAKELPLPSNELTLHGERAPEVVAVVIQQPPRCEFSELSNQVLTFLTMHK